MPAPWDAAFERLLRSELRGADDSVALEPDMPLGYYGLTSLGYLQLGMKLSQRYGIAMHSFDERSFRTAGSLWTFVRENDAGRATGTNQATGRQPTVAVPALLDRFTTSARLHPDAACLIDGDETLSYAEVADQASALASVIGAGGVVAVLGEREAPTYRAYLAAMYAGAAVVPLSMEFPPERNADIVRQAGVRCVVHADRRKDRLLDAQLGALGDVAVVDGSAPPLTAVRTASCQKVSPDATAYFIFTSGSTGRPKGVGVTHRNIDAFLSQALPNFAVGPGDVFSQCHGLTFDFSVFEMWGAWSTGAALLPVSRIQALDPADMVTRHGVTVWACTPSLVASAAAAGRLTAGSMPTLRHIVIGGEPLPSSTVRLARAAAPNAVIDNVYGPTETTVWTTTYRIRPDESLLDESVPIDPILPIGTPVPGVDVRVSASGELLLAGPQVFGGYVDPTLDAAKFVVEEGRRWYRTGDLVGWGEDGLLHHRGRIDGQVKVRGYRVELGEIEQAASRLVGSARTAALLMRDGSVDAELVLFVEAPSVNEAAVRRELGRVLPGYMVPGRVIAVDAFRLTAHAKLDHGYLASLASPREAVARADVPA
ncbi:MAG: AMP-binding protein [Frankiaceae bacterium]